MATDAERALGTFLRNHPTDNGRRGWVAVVEILVGVALAAIAVPVTITVFTDEPDGSTLAGLLWGGALIGICFGLPNGLRVTTRHGEVFVLRQDGLVYRRTGETRVVPWTAIRRSADHGVNNALGRLMGRDVHMSIRVEGGGKLLLTGFTQDAAGLAATIRAACPQSRR
ncbi:hypothetical protein [Embleya sp. NPDC005971]|uniref:hypothetical protein n=1 Tax=Embleya sp. NPDC005971 TaxID=3156724 RepID=UPI0034055026